MKNSKKWIKSIKITFIFYFLQKSGYNYRSTDILCWFVTPFILYLHAYIWFSGRLLIPFLIFLILKCSSNSEAMLFKWFVLKFLENFEIKLFWNIYKKSCLLLLQCLFYLPWWNYFSITSDYFWIWAILHKVRLDAYSEFFMVSYYFNI